MEGFPMATNDDVFRLLSTIHDQLARSEDVEIAWRNDVSQSLRRVEDALQRIEYELRRRSTE